MPSLPWLRRSFAASLTPILYVYVLRAECVYVLRAERHCRAVLDSYARAQCAFHRFFDSFAEASKRSYAAAEGSGKPLRSVHLYSFIFALVSALLFLKMNFLADPAVPNSNSETNAFYGGPSRAGGLVGFIGAGTRGSRCPHGPP